MFDRLFDRFKAPAEYRSAPNYSIGATYNDAQGEARRRGDRKVGTEHILLALLHDPESAKAVGRDLELARAALDALDRDALAAVGIRGVPELPAITRREPGRLQLTPGAKSVLVGAGKEAPGVRLAPQHVLLSLLRRDWPDPAAELLGAMGVDAGTVRQRLRQVPAQS